MGYGKDDNLRISIPRLAISQGSWGRCPGSFAHRRLLAPRGLAGEDQEAISDYQRDRRNHQRPPQTIPAAMQQWSRQYAGPYPTLLCDGCPQDLLPAAREYYYGQPWFGLSSQDAVVAREDVNVESLIAHDPSSLSADDELEAVVSACEAFIRTLCRGTCRSTLLRPVIDGLDTSLSPTRKKLKLRCYTPLSVLANRQSDFADALQPHQLQYSLVVELEWKETAFEAIRWCAEYYRLLGQYGTAQTILDQAIASPDWATADERTRAHFVFTRAGKMDEARQSLKNAQCHCVLAGRCGTAQGLLLTQTTIILAEVNFVNTSGK